MWKPSSPTSAVIGLGLIFESVFRSNLRKTGACITKAACRSLSFHNILRIFPGDRFSCSSSRGTTLSTMTEPDSEPVLKQFQGPHKKCRNSAYPRTENLQRSSVPDEKVSWSVSWPEYNPLEYNDPRLNAVKWADPGIEDRDFKPKWNCLDESMDRRSFVTKAYELIDNRPRNPLGRTGVTGRGCLGKWGPNHAADPIVTRWKGVKQGSLEKHSSTGLPVLQFVAVLRRDCHQWALPGGMVDLDEKVSVTLQREFGEEALASLDMTEEERKSLEKSIKELFRSGRTIYKGYVDDPRNTDNAWLETVAVNFHDENGQTVGRVNLKAGDDAVGVQWMDIGREIELYASHRQFLEAVARLRGAHW